ncbi:putative beta-glucosidase [Hortaea werneckii]|nr:putative beta-glucosidase [Hortaea werneckii]
MAFTKHHALAASLLVSQIAGQSGFATSDRSEDAFSFVQPAEWPILGPYGNSPEVLPSPNMTGNGGWDEAFQRAQAFVDQLTVEEKALMVTGAEGPCVGNIQPIERLGFNGLCLQDGPLSIRYADYASVFSAGVSAACTWDRDILHERGMAMGKEFKGKGAHVALAPVCGALGRSGYAGRNWEGFSPDQYLTGIATAQTIMGIQDAGVQATAKHYIGNEQETQRNPTFATNGSLTAKDQEAISSNIDDRTMHEAYLWPFANAVKANVASVMCAYQRLNGSYACQNTKAQNGLLKGELGFQGYIMSDWGAVHSGVSSMEGGLDMNMPGGLGSYGFTFKDAGSYFGGNVSAAIRNGSIPESRVDDMIHRIMTPYYLFGQDKEDYPLVDPSSVPLNTNFGPRSQWDRQDWSAMVGGESSRDVRGNHSALIRKHANAATVLLKNANNTLPLKAPRSIAVFGNDAGNPTEGFYNQNNYEFGNLVVGGGSGTGRLSYLDTPLDALKRKAYEDGALLQQWLNNTLIAESDVTDLWIAPEPEVCIVMLKTWAEEADDRESLGFDWNGEAVVNSVAKACGNTVVVTHSAGINLYPFADHPNVTAIIAAHYPGTESGQSMIDTLYGINNPSGKLPYTVAYDGDDYNAPPVTSVGNNTGQYAWQVYFEEGLEIDYRHFDAQNIDVRYEFGFGLSYSTFELSDLSIEPVQTDITSEAEDLPIVPGGNPALWETLYNVSATVTNTGDRDGAQVAQLYVAFPDSAPEGTPVQQLRGFEKPYLCAGESKQVYFEIMRRDLSYWDVVSQQWLIPEGEFKFNVGFSSRDFRLNGAATVVNA